MTHTQLLAGGFALLALPATLPAAAVTPSAARRPNVILIMTDDQGHGDAGFHSNRRGPEAASRQGQRRA